MINLEEIISFVKTVEGLSKDKEVANLFGLSSPDFSKRKKTGTLLKLVLEWGIAKKVNLHRLLTGEDKPEGKEEWVIADEYPDEDPEAAELLTLTAEILKSASDYSISLAANIRSFHRAISTEKRLDIFENRLKTLENGRTTDCRIRERGSTKKKAGY